MSRRTLLGLALAALVAGCASPPSRPLGPEPAVGSMARTAPPAPSAAVPAEALNPDVRQETVQATICVPGYTASVRPSTSYTNGVKVKLLREQGLPLADASKYELDHRLSLSLGGHPRNLKNLQLQPWEGEDGAKRKDRLEQRLQQLVCAGKVMLDKARQEMYFDWRGAFRTYVEAP